MPIVTACPKCQSKYQLPDKALGKTIECQKCGHKFPVAQTGQPIAAAAAVSSGSAAGKIAATAAQVASASANELAKFGLDGPLRRQPDPLAESFSPPPKDILGNFAADPGFAATQVGEKGAKDAGQSAVAGLDAIISNPYANQARSALPVADMSKAPGVGYASLKTATTIALVTLAVPAACLLVIAGMLTYFWTYIADFVPGSPPPFDQETLKTYTQLLGISSLVFLFSIPVYTVAFSLFNFQGYENLSALGTKELSFGSILSAFSWFIPLGNFVLPLLTMAELSRASQKPIGDQWRSKSVGIKVWIWWGLLCAFWIGPIVLVFVAGIAQMTGGSFESFQQRALFLVISYWSLFLLFASSLVMFGSLAFGIAADQDKAWPIARKSRQGTGKPAPAAIPYLYSGLILIAACLGLITGSIMMLIAFSGDAEPTLVNNLMKWGGSAVLGLLGIASGIYGAIFCVKAAR